MAKLTTVSFTGKSGKKYSFDVYKFDTSWKDVSAVYIVTHAKPKSNGGHTHSVIYIGQTDNLKERFSNHNKQKCFEENEANRLCILMEQDEKTRLSIESDLIDLHDTPCND